MVAKILTLRELDIPIMPANPLVYDSTAREIDLALMDFYTAYDAALKQGGYQSVFGIVADYRDRILDIMEQV